MAVLPEVRARSSAPLIALLADRDADSRGMYAEYLRRSAYRVEETEDGRDALARAITIQPDVVVAETRLPGINGRSVCVDMDFRFKRRTKQWNACSLFRRDKQNYSALYSSRTVCGTCSI